MTRTASLRTDPVVAFPTRGEAGPRAAPSSANGTDRAGAVYATLERHILAGTLAPGTSLDPPVLAQALGLDEGDIRTALALLARARLVRTAACACFVRQILPEEAAALYEVRATLEDLVGRLAARRAGEADIDELRALTRQAKLAGRARDADASRALDRRFHDTLAQFACNEALLAAYRTLANELHLYEREAPAPPGETLVACAREHAAIVQAIVQRHGGRAGRLLRRHAMHCRALLHPVPADGEPGDLA